MQIETYTVRCDACRGRGYEGYTICPKCEGNGQVVIVDERQTLRTARDGFLGALRSMLGGVK